MALALAALLGFLLGVLATVFASRQRASRKLFFGMLHVAPLPDGAAGSTDYELLHDGAHLEQPHLLQVHLTTKGHKGVSSRDFDAGNPIRLDVGTKIISVLESTATPEFPTCPPVKIVGTTLEIGPGNIGNRQRLAFALVIDSGEPQITCDSKLIDVETYQRDDLTVRG